MIYNAKVGLFLAEEYDINQHPRLILVGAQPVAWGFTLASGYSTKWSV
jgi:hypothetical protein